MPKNFLGIGREPRGPFLHNEQEETFILQEWPSIEEALCFQIFGSMVEQLVVE
jgi:hypothetical protein